MQRFLSVIAILLLYLLCFSCNKTESLDTDWTSAIITGQDVRRCACCGGFMITFSDDPDPYDADFHLWQEDFQWIEETFGISAGSDFPLAVEIQYRLVENPCKGWQNIEIDQLRFQ